MLNTAQEILADLENITVIAPFAAVLGFALSFLQGFLPSDRDILLEALQSISN